MKKLLGLFLIIANVAFAEPPQNPNQTLVKSASTGLTLQDSLSKNVYKQVPYQEAYQVRVPPYSRIEYYTENVLEYYQTCRMVRDSRRQCFEPIRDCRMEEVCGTNALGERVCKKENRCTERENCREVPYDREVCERHSRYVPVTRSREVEEFHYQTRYRTAYRSEYDYQVAMDLVVNFPKGSELFGAEQETFFAQLVNAESQPDISLSLGDTILGYRIADKKKNGRTVIYSLEMTPKYSAEEVGRSSIRGLGLTMKADGSSALRFSDAGLRQRIQTAYSYQVTDKNSNQIVVEGKLNPTSNGQVLLPLSGMSPTADYVVSLRVVRQGIVLPNDVDFTVSVVELAGPQDETEFKNRSNVGGIKLIGEMQASYISFFDKSPTHPAVKTVYIVSVELRKTFGGREEVGSFTVDRNSLKEDQYGNFGLMLARDLKVSAKNLNKAFAPGNQIFMKVKAVRTNQRMNNGHPIEILKEESHLVPHNQDSGG